MTLHTGSGSDTASDRFAYAMGREDLKHLFGLQLFALIGTTIASCSPWMLGWCLSQWE